MIAILNEFREIEARTGYPFGFGCVAFTDLAFPGFPTFPVIHLPTHMAIFDGHFLPEGRFTNQDADPFLFQIYRAFGAAGMRADASLLNRIGGAHAARYDKVPCNDWSGELLAAARKQASVWLGSPPLVTLDIVIPTFRAPREMLESAISLPVPEGVSTQVTIICDNPGNAEAETLMAELETRHRRNPFVRIRMNKANLGAGPTRNRGLLESAADWVLFLDDDVVPEATILEAYKNLILAYPRATGFVGSSVLPPPQTPRQAGIVAAGVSFFWTVAATFPTATEIPWGVTANLCSRRAASVTFDDTGNFPRTGGGEDIDFCLRMRRWAHLAIADSQGFVAAPQAVIHHPWWDGGSPRLSHFSGWAYGDGHLIDLYPEFTYYNLPDLSETVGCLVAGALLSAVVSRTAPLAALALAAGAIVADYGCDLATLLFVPPPSCAHLSVVVRAQAALQCLAVRTWSECGRLRGHAGRGTLHRNLFRRFNWFGQMWPGAVQEERINSSRRSAVRLAVAVAVAIFALRTTY